MKTEPAEIEVGCAVIVRQGRLLIAQRSPGSHLGGYWEFPGGKREKGESIEACLAREVMEELGVVIRPRQEIRVTRYVYPGRTLVLRFFLCDYVSGNPLRRECMNFAWVQPEELHRYLFPPADRDMIRDIILKKRYYFRTGYFY